MVELPMDIWLCITQFLSDDGLKELLGVNHFFYNLAMDLRYNTVTLEDPSLATVKRIERLRSVLGRVREIRMQYLTEEEQGSRSSCTSQAPQSEASLARSRQPASSRKHLSWEFPEIVWTSAKKALLQQQSSDIAHT
jgi:hypothetical protein